jgi:rRNA-processing protein FCF1
LVEILCDTSFLIHIATKRIKNISNLDTEIGQVQFLVPDVVIKELEKLSKQDEKKQEILATVNYSKNLKKIVIAGKFADQALIDYIKQHGGIIATMDKELKKKIKNFGGSIMSLSNNRIVLET